MNNINLILNIFFVSIGVYTLYRVVKIDNFLIKEKKNSGEKDWNEDELYQAALSAVVEAQTCSASYLQRRLKIGYARAANLMDLLEKNGIVASGEGAKPRKVLRDE